MTDRDESDRDEKVDRWVAHEDDYEYGVEDLIDPEPDNFSKIVKEPKGGVLHNVVLTAGWLRHLLHTTRTTDPLAERTTKPAESVERRRRATTEI